jgi:hypothetical protein
VLTRTIGWLRRQHPGTTAPLGWGSEYWDRDPSNYEGSEQLRDRYVGLGYKPPRRGQLADLFTSGPPGLLTDVIVAAGGVEHSLNSLRAALAKAQEVADEHAKPGMGLGDETITDAWYEFANLLSWARSLEERLDQRPPPRKRGAPRIRRQGLLPALKPKRLRRRVDQLVQELKDGPLRETRWLANRSLHAGLVQHSFSGGHVDEHGRIRLPIPDKLTGPVDHWYVFKWGEDRDAWTFAEELWRSIEKFMDGLLDAFESAMPKRLRKATT